MHNKNVTAKLNLTLRIIFRLIFDTILMSVIFEVYFFLKVTTLNYFLTLLFSNNLWLLSDGAILNCKTALFLK